MRRERCNWKRHCASHECEECQEGSEFRIIVQSRKRHVGKVILEREQPYGLEGG